MIIKKKMDLKELKEELSNKHNLEINSYCELENYIFELDIILRQWEEIENEVKKLK